MKLKKLLALLAASCLLLGVLTACGGADGQESGGASDENAVQEPEAAREPANAEKPKPYQRKEHYNPYDWYDKRDRDRMPNRH